jgi:hypothetical protein
MLCALMLASGGSGPPATTCKLRETSISPRSQKGIAPGCPRSDQQGSVDGCALPKFRPFATPFGVFPEHLEPKIPLPPHRRLPSYVPPVPRPGSHGHPTIVLRRLTSVLHPSCSRPKPHHSHSARFTGCLTEQAAHLPQVPLCNQTPTPVTALTQLPTPIG